MVPTSVLSLTWVCTFPRALKPGREFSKRKETPFSGDLKAVIRYDFVSLYNICGLIEEEGSYCEFGMAKVSSLPEAVQPYTHLDSTPPTMANSIFHIETV